MSFRYDLGTSAAALPWYVSPGLTRSQNPEAAVPPRGEPHGRRAPERCTGRLWHFAPGYGCSLPSRIALDNGCRLEMLGRLCPLPEDGFQPVAGGYGDTEDQRVPTASRRDNPVA